MHTVQVFMLLLLLLLAQGTGRFSVSCTTQRRHTVGLCAQLQRHNVTSSEGYIQRDLCHHENKSDPHNNTQPPAFSVWKMKLFLSF